MKHLHTFESFLNEAKRPNVTYNADPKAMVAFNESKGPYKVGVAIYKGKTADESIIFPQLGDKGLNMVVAGPGFRAEWAKQLGISEDLYGQMNFNVNTDELIALAKKAGFKKTRGDDYEKDARTPEDALKELVAFLKPHIDKLAKK
jgi:hypothetical protein